MVNKKSLSLNIMTSNTKTYFRLRQNRFIDFAICHHSSDILIYSSN
jgi:hypothetical protein